MLLHHTPTKVSYYFADGLVYRGNYGVLENIFGGRRVFAPKIRVGCEQVCAERREMLTGRRIFIIAKSQPKVRG